MRERHCLFIRKSAIPGGVSSGLTCVNERMLRLMTKLITPTLIIHGGAGVPLELGPEIEASARDGLTNALRAGFDLLQHGGGALDAVEAAVRAMEDDPVFNAGIGGALTSAGHVEHDAAIMDGATRNAGAVTGTRRVLNPVSLARKVMTVSPQVCLSGEGAEEFAARINAPLVDPSIFVTPRRIEALRRVQAGSSKHVILDEQDQHGTVGAVALDAQGHLAAATSTGGRTNKWPGRVGDTPLIGAGTYADDATVAVSCTGHGEYFMRCVTAYRVAALVELGGLSVDEASHRAIAEIGRMGGTGGLIAIDARGRYAMPYNSRGMYRGVISEDGIVSVSIA